MSENCTNFRLFGKWNADIVWGLYEFEELEQQKYRLKSGRVVFYRWFFVVTLSLSVCVHTGSHSITGSTFACAICVFFPLKLTDDSDLQIFAMHFNNMCKQVNVIEYILVPISKWATVISYNFAFIGLEFTCFSMLLLWLMNYCKR